jgi:uncharacterized protein
MELSDFLKIGEVNEVQGKTIKAGVYSDKNTEYLNFNGTILKNVGIGSFVLIRKGFNNIIGKVDGEFIKEINCNERDYAPMGNAINRIISISILGGFKHDRFVHGLTELPLIGNFVYILEESAISKIFSFNSPTERVRIGKIIGHDDYPFEIGVQEIVCSHVGIFGNTGSGKSNTLAKLYSEIIDKYSDFELFKKNSKFLVLDFNGEYGNVFPNADKYGLSTKPSYGYNVDPKTGELPRYPIPFEEILNQDYWAIILEATEKTQKPFIKRTIKLYQRIYEKREVFSIEKMCELIIRTQIKYPELKYTIGDILETFGLAEAFENFEDVIHYNGQTRQFYMGVNTYGIDADTIKSNIFSEVTINSDDIYTLSPFEMFEFALKYNYWQEISRNYVTKEHIAPLLARANNRCEELEKVFIVLDEKSYKEKLKSQSNVEVLSLLNLNIAMKKIIPMIICKIKYAEKKESKRTLLNSTLHFIVDEAHNILSDMSTRESEEWKDYRLESFEEFIKEGRKFGVFLTIASQRPSDISDTIISQLHNYFIHRLVNEEDLRKMYRTVAFADKASNEMIPILPAGGCLVSGLATNFPVLVQVDMLSEKQRPKSENVDIQQAWVKAPVKGK